MSIVPEAKKISLIVSIIYILVPLVIAGRAWWVGDSPDSLILVIIIAFILASGYRIYGEELMGKATEEAKELTGQGEGEEEEGGEEE